MRDKGFWLDFKTKIAYYGESGHRTDCVPATEAERKAFIAHFYSKGVKSCTFRELKQFVAFHGVRIDGRVYATINVTNPFVYRDLVKKRDELQAKNPQWDYENLLYAVEDYIIQAKSKTTDNEVKRKANIAAKYAIKEFIKAIDKKIDEIYKIY